MSGHESTMMRVLQAMTTTDTKIMTIFSCRVLGQFSLGQL